MGEKVLIVGAGAGGLSGFNLGGKAARVSRRAAHCVEVRS